MRAQGEQCAVDDSGIKAEEQAGKRAGEGNAIEVTCVNGGLRRQVAQTPAG
jgi:hypothetical protein